MRAQHDIGKKIFSGYSKFEFASGDAS